MGGGTDKGKPFARPAQIEDTVMSSGQKILVAAALYGVWFALVVMKMTPADGYVNAVLGALTALGTIHVQGRSNQ